MIVREATVHDAPSITDIYNAGIASRRATFETELRTPADTARRMESAFARHTWLVADSDGEIAGWAATMPYSNRSCYDGVAEFSIYVAPAHQGQGVGRLLLTALLDEATRAGLHKVTSRILTVNEPSRRLCASLGFREVGTHLRHGRLDGVWHDVVTIEILLGEGSSRRSVSKQPSS
jgi:L-amino acid N-acyltransferase YncA